MKSKDVVLVPVMVSCETYSYWTVGRGERA